MQIQVVAHDSDPDTLCAAVGRLSRDKGVASEVLARYREDPERAGEVLGRILSMGHHAVAEHAHFTIAFDRVPVTVEWFIIQFRLGSYLVKSRRYVDYRQAGYEMPELPAELRPEFQRFTERMFEAYGRLVDEGTPRLGRGFVEDARFVLPYSFHSSFFCTMNARELAYCLYQATRGWGAESPSVRQAGEMVLEQLREIAPRLFSASQEEKRGDTLAELIGDELSPQGEDSPPVELWGAPENADEEVALAALFEESLASREDLRRWLSAEPNRLAKVISAVCESPRPRALEQISLRFRINRVSWSSLTHFARHRIYSPIFPGLEKSCDNTRFVMPETIESVSALREIYLEAWGQAREFSRFLIDRGVPPVQRVNAGLSGNLADFVASFNARELELFFRLRCCETAQHEIRRRADEMLRLAKSAAPLTFANAGPACVSRTRCGEGANTCGRAGEIVRKYRGSAQM